MSKIRLRFILPLMLFFHLIVVLGCAPGIKSRKEKYRETKMLMGTIVHLDVCTSDPPIQKIDAAYQKTWERLEEIAWRMNVLDDRSDVAKINNSNLEPVSVGADTYHVLKSSLHFSRVTKGAFDITVWPLIKLWRESEKNNALPTAQQIEAVQTAVGLTHIQLLDNNLVKLLNTETKIDLGGIAKGYAIDEAARIFRENGIMDFFIDAGGDIYVGGRNCEGEPWRIGIRDPQDKSKILDVVRVSDGAVTTSGDYEQYYTIQNEHWSHIINPDTGYPQKGVISATVIAPNAMEADALATALCVLGAEAGTNYINMLHGPYASLIIVKRKTGSIEKSVSREYERYHLQP